MRKPIASDRFYNGNPAELSEQIKGFLLDVKSENVKIAIAPHAGYIYSGKCAGEVYSRMRLGGKIDSVVLIGPNHSGIGSEICLSFQSFLTPLGKTDVDLELGKLILKNAENEKLDAEENKEAHNVEHSLEVQLPFLQTVFTDNVKIVPILLQDLSYENCTKFAKIVYDSVNDLNRNVKIIISSDFTHYGESYDFIPFTENVRENLYKLGGKAIEFILNFDSNGFYDYALEKTTICGIFAITVGIELAKLLKCKNAEKVCFYNSGDITGDYSNCVNYVGMVFW